MKIRFYATLRYVVGVKSDRFDYHPGCILKTSINQNVNRYPGLAHELYDEEGNFRSHL